MGKHSEPHEQGGRAEDARAPRPGPAVERVGPEGVQLRLS